MPSTDMAGTEPLSFELVRKSYVLRLWGRTATLELVASPNEEDRKLFPRPWSHFDVGFGWVAWRLTLG